MSGQTILLVEDELLIGTQLAGILGEVAYSVAEACYGAEALRALKPVGLPSGCLKT